MSHAILPALADAAPAANPSLASPAGLEAVAHLVSALAWPAIVVAILLIFRVPIAALLPKVQEIQIGSFKAKLVDALEEAGQNVEKGSGKSGEPTHSELKQAYAVEALADPADIGILRAQAQALGTEYEKVRNTMRPGNARTLEMEKVVAKMRVLGRPSCKSCPTPTISTGWSIASARNARSSAITPQWRCWQRCATNTRPTGSARCNRRPNARKR